MNRDEHLQQRLIDIAASLLRRTQEGKISWTTTDDESMFIFSGTNTSVQISSKLDHAGDTLTRLSILNSRGTVVETIQNEFPEAPDGGYTYAAWNEPLDELYYAARRSALNVDEMLDDLLADLDDENDTKHPAKEQRIQAGPDEPPF